MSRAKPNSRRNLDLAIERLFGRENYVAKRAIIANAIVSQLLPSGVVKGGSAIKMRLGDETTRFTSDLDVARATSIENFSREISLRLEKGWEGFTGVLSKEKQAQPTNVPKQYVMQPFSIKLAYNQKPWMTVSLEVGFDEIGDADNPDFVIPEDANRLLLSLGFPKLGPVPVMALEYQIAQKLHALSEPNSTRVHDLIDLQLLENVYDEDYSLLKSTCMRLFAYRKMQSWPPVIVQGKSWSEMYINQRPSKDLIPNVEEAVGWVNQFIQKIDNS